MEFSPQTGEISPTQFKAHIGSPGTGTGELKPPKPPIGCTPRQGPGIYGTDLLVRTIA